MKIIIAILSTFGVLFGYYKLVSGATAGNDGTFALGVLILFASQLAFLINLTDLKK